jgi:hypothetical protein
LLTNLRNVGSNSKPVTAFSVSIWDKIGMVSKVG